MKPIITRGWVAEPNRIAAIWSIFGIPVYGKTFMPWEMSSNMPWAHPDEVEREFNRQMLANQVRSGNIAADPDCPLLNSDARGHNERW